MIKIVEKHQDSLKTEYRGEYGYLWLESHAFSGVVDSFQAAFKCLTTRFPHAFLAPRYLDLTTKSFIIQVVDRNQGTDQGTYRVYANGQVESYTD